MKRIVGIGICLVVIFSSMGSAFASEKGYEILTPYKYDSIQQAVGDIVVAVVNEQTGAENLKGKTILPFAYKDIEIVCNDKGEALGLLVLKDKNGSYKYELYNLFGKRILNTDYDHAHVSGKFVILGKGIEDERQDGVFDFSNQAMVIPLSPKRIDTDAYDNLSLPKFPLMKFSILFEESPGYNPQLDDRYDFTVVNEKGDTIIPKGRYAYLHSYAPYNIIDCYDENMKIVAQYTNEGQKLSFSPLPTKVHIGLFALRPEIFAKSIFNRFGQFSDQDKLAAWKNGKYSLLKLNPSFDRPSTWAVKELETARELNLVPYELDIAYQSPCSREEFCIYLSRMLEEYSGKKLETLVGDYGELKTFQDCPRYEVSVAYTLGIVSGINVTTFNPEAKISREQAAAILGRTARFLEIESNSQALIFKDEDTFSNYAIEDIAFVSSIKGKGVRVMTGVGNDRFNPRGTYSREQAVATLLRLHGVE